MHLEDIVCRDIPPAPWAEGENIPWNEEAFSRRMLAEHLCQDHDRASYRREILDAYARWLHENALGARPGRVLDLTCGPGLITQRLARLGHCCMGIDFAPAAIAYARQQAESEGLACTYALADVREAYFGEAMDLAMMLQGQLNVFRRGEAAAILRRAFRALAPGGQIVLEMQSYEAVRDGGRTRRDWMAAEAGLFAEDPHVVLSESFWIGEDQARVDRHYVIDAATGRVGRMALTNEAYTGAEIEQLLTDAGFSDIRLPPSLPTVAIHPSHLLAVAAKPVHPS